MTMFFLRFFLLLLVTTIMSTAKAQDAVFIPADSVRVTRLLQQCKTDAPASPMLWFGRQFVGTPYEAHTLEVGDTERLIVRLQSFDCLTFVETVLALSLCHVNDQRTFSDFCRYLQQIRYRNGIIDGYTSRLHYFTWWADENVRHNFIVDAADSTGTTRSAFTAMQTLRLNYMSTHPQSYIHLNGHPERINAIRQMERRYDNTRWAYIPKSRLNATACELHEIRTGDIISLITFRQGLDNSHVGIAYWQNGRLHLLHASSVRHRVILDTETLYDYCRRQSSLLGVRVYRLKR